MTRNIDGASRVLLVGGHQLTPQGGGPSVPEVYDPATVFFSAAGSPKVDRIQCTATLLTDGTVLVAGGINSSAVMEIYDPATGTFATTTSLPAAFSYQTATLLTNDKVLVAGGYLPCPNGCATTSLNTAEIYDPVAKVFAATGSMSIARTAHFATLLNNVSVLVVGGGDQAPQRGTAELYDPASGIFTAAGALEMARSYNTATLLNDGTVLIVGGSSLQGQTLASAELYEPTPLAPYSLQVTPLQLLCRWDVAH